MQTASVRLRACSLATIAVRLLRTVPTERWNWAAISVGSAPCAAARSTSRSRGVKRLPARSQAATPKQIRKLIGTEALLVGLLACVPGALVGIPLGSVLYARLVAFGIVPANLRQSFSPLPPLIAAFVTLVAAWGAARISARRATRIRPVEALAEAELSPSRISWVRALFGVLVAAGALTLNLLLTVFHTDAAGQPVSLVATLLWCTALSLLGPLVARLAVAVLGVFLRLSPVGGFLAGANLRARAHRLAALIAPSPR